MWIGSTAFYFLDLFGNSSTTATTYFFNLSVDCLTPRSKVLQIAFLDNP